jgi:NAD(P)-dependent dehydrogenase (short-subunit alcohol dehydrogenase family)
MVSSIGGRVALPMAGAYAASKFGLEAVSDALRRELRELGVHVVLVEPGGIRTPIWRKGVATAERMQEGMPADVERLYGTLIAAARRQSERIANETGLPPEEVARVVGTALTTRRPRTRYLVGRDAKVRATIAKWLPDRVFDALVARALARAGS